jgi:hypothetical protein
MSMKVTPVIQRLHRHLVFGVLASVSMALAVSSCVAQTATGTKSSSTGKKLAPARPDDAAPAAKKAPAKPDPFEEWTAEFDKYPGLLPELAHLADRLRQNVTTPAPRAESKLLPLVPASTTVYVAAPNYGDALRQTVDTFNDELKQSEVLRDWWTHGKVAAAGPKLVDGLDKIAQLYQYLGGETVYSFSIDPQHPKKMSSVLIAEVRKPGFDAALRQALPALGDAATVPYRVLDSKELATAKESPAGKSPLLILVRRDFVIATSDLATLRSYDAYLTSAKHDFVSSPFGAYVGKAYGGGATLMAAADLQPLLQLARTSFGTKDTEQYLQKSGFADVQYVSWKHGLQGGQLVGRGELSFTGPRQGPAAWLDKPGPLGSLDFLSPQASLAMVLNLRGFSQIFDDVQKLAGPANANSFAAIAGGEKALNLKLKDDLLDLLPGEIAFEMDAVNAGQPVWKTVLKVNDLEHLQKTFTALLNVTHFPVQQTTSGNVTFNTLQIPGQKPTEVDYALSDGYLVVGSSRDVLSEAFRLHGSPDSLAKSPKYLASLPAGQSADASAVFYQNAQFTATSALNNLPPQFAEVASHYLKDLPPTVTRFYGEPSAIRSISTTSGFDVGGMMIGAAIAIPNLLRSRNAANEAGAVASVRSVIAAQNTYSTLFAKAGYAPDLASLGPDPKNPHVPSAARAGLILDSLAEATCTGNNPCVKSGYEFRLHTPCAHAPCKEYVVVATPVDSNAGLRTFCATSDEIIRQKIGKPETATVSATACRTWDPLK